MGRELLKKRGVREAARALARPTTASGSAVTAATTRACRRGARPLNASGAKIVGVPVDTGVDASAYFDLRYSARRTASLYIGVSFGGCEEPLASTTAAPSEISLSTLAIPRSTPAL